MGEAFSYIVPTGGAAPLPSIAAHDVGCVDDVGERSGPGGAERAYMVVLNAVDTIRVLEVRRVCRPTVALNCLASKFSCKEGFTSIIRQRAKMVRDRGFSRAEIKARKRGLETTLAQSKTYK